MNNALVTTGIEPLTIGSTEVYVAKPYKGGVPWDLTGGTALLLFTDPNGVTSTLTATIASGVASVGWTVVAPIGTWLRAWKLTDAAGIVQVSQPIVFRVISSPS